MGSIIDESDAEDERDCGEFLMAGKRCHLCARSLGIATVSLAINSRFRLLLGQAMECAQTPDEFAAINRDDAARGKKLAR